MTAVLDSPRVAPLDPRLEAREPPEVRGRGRDDVRLLVSRGIDDVRHGSFADFPTQLCPGDVMVVNTSATFPAALAARHPDGRPLRIHLSTELPGGLWLVEAREPVEVATVPFDADLAGASLALPGRGNLVLFDRFAGSQRLWVGALHLDRPVLAYLALHGEPIRYRHAAGPWPLDAYQHVFGSQAGSAEMPSAARPFTRSIVTDLVRRGIVIVTVVLHAGVSSLEAGEDPYPERYEVSASTASVVNAARAQGGRVVAVGTTVVRALETVVDPSGLVHAGRGWTDVVVTPARGASAVDGVLTGWHEPEASHLLMLEAIAGRPALERAYEHARDAGYLWHEFGDSHLILP